MKKYLSTLQQQLSQLSFRTDVIVLSLCIPFYILSIVQTPLPISVEAKGVLWIVFFGLAKMFQYGSLAILGTEGWKRLRAALRRNK